MQHVLLCVVNTPTRLSTSPALPHPSITNRTPPQCCRTQLHNTPLATSSSRAAAQQGDASNRISRCPTERIPREPSNSPIEHLRGSKSCKIVPPGPCMPCQCPPPSPQRLGPGSPFPNNPSAHNLGRCESSVLEPLSHWIYAHKHRARLVSNIKGSPSFVRHVDADLPEPSKSHDVRQIPKQ